MNSTRVPLPTRRSKSDRNMGLGDVMRGLRKSAKLTQADIACALGLERTSVCNIEGGLQALTIEKLHAFADHLGLEAVVQFRPKRRGAGPAAQVLTSTG